MLGRRSQPRAVPLESASGAATQRHTPRHRGRGQTAITQQQWHTPRGTARQGDVANSVAGPGNLGVTIAANVQRHCTVDGRGVERAIARAGVRTWHGTSCRGMASDAEQRDMDEMTQLDGMRRQQANNSDRPASSVHHEHRTEHIIFKTDER